MEGFFDRVWAQIGTILQDRRPVVSHHHPPPNAIPDTVLTLYEDNEQEEQEQDPEEPEDPIALMTDEEFIKDYAGFLHAHYGRPPQFLTDLYCCMAPIMVEMTSGDTKGLHTLHRYWWLPVNHPLVIRMHALREPNCGQVNAGFCGSFVIYADSIIVKWIGELWKLFYNELGKELEVPKKDPTEQEKTQESQPGPSMIHTVSNKKGD